ncbi:hypothetical protein A8C32_17005 [Flavivirga aquatica]|uniref:Sulfatase n=1 Tax=Flavivirga aquatica TaxID=1849968 RepID=A0A1E5T8P0_9FLAO|nr:sulfatase-like hydrolase/transferase [Flavivirga aquatica]OEK07677.1 hypothetical protein A8C32_17005 [Flavivirga aquatica]
MLKITQINLQKLVFLAFFGVTSLFAQNKPNIVYIIADDLGYGDVQFMNNNTPIASPNLLSLANKGTVFTDAYVSHPFCGPSRMSIMTGRYPHQLGVQYNLPEKIESGISSEVNSGIPAGETMLSEAIKNTGYSTAAFGKWHLGLKEGFRPIDRGFDFFYGFLGGGHRYNDGYIATYNREIAAGKTKFQINAYDHPYEKEERRGARKVITEILDRRHASDVIGDESAAYINRQRTSNKPFFMYVAFNAPHAPLQPLASDERNAARPGKSIPNKSKKYAGLVRGLDRNVGKIVSALKSAGKFNNTLIIFLSDNGGKNIEGASNAPLQGVKGDVKEGGFRVPMLWHWPNNNKISGSSRKTFRHPVSTVDLYPTLIQIGKGNINFGKSIGREHKTFDGKSILRNVESNVNPRPYKPSSNNIKDYIFALRHRGGFNEVAIRQGKWKAFRNNQTNNAPWKLFDITKDKGENRNIATNNSTNRQVLKNLISFGKSWATGNAPKPRFFGSVKPKNYWNNGSLPKYGALFDQGIGSGTSKEINTKGVITSAEENNSISIFSNNMSRVIIELGINSGNTEVNIFDIYGRLAKSSTIEGRSKTINVDDLNGVYIIKVENENYSITKKLILK